MHSYLRILFDRINSAICLTENEPVLEVERDEDIIGDLSPELYCLYALCIGEIQTLETLKKEFDTKISDASFTVQNLEKCIDGTFKELVITQQSKALSRLLYCALCHDFPESAGYRMDIRKGWKVVMIWNYYRRISYMPDDTPPNERPETVALMKKLGFELPPPNDSGV